LSLNSDDSKRNDSSKFLAQNADDHSIEVQNSIDSTAIKTRNDKSFSQCSSAGDIYSDEELSE
jgi:hypothetical protein